jgi:hypothetical protein
MDELSLELSVDPVALVSRAEARAVLTRQVAQRVAGLPYLLASPVTLRVSCPTRPVLAPGLVEYPNLARWLAPLTEALVGAGRVLLSTSQVTDVQVTTAPPDAPPNLVVTLIHRPGQRLSKADLRLVAFQGGWCAPVPTTLSTVQAEVATRGLCEALTAEADPVGRGFLRRHDLAPDVPVVPADVLLGETGSTRVPSML